MIKFPKLKEERIELERYQTDITFDSNQISELFNGRNSIEDIYAELLSEGGSLNQINDLFDTLFKNDLVADKINLQSSELNVEEVEKNLEQIDTLAKFSKEVNESKYANQMVGLEFQEKISKTQLAIYGKSRLQDDIFNKSKLLGVSNILKLNDIDSLLNIKEGILVYAPKEYNEDELLTLLQYCHDNHIDFLPAIPTRYGIEIGPFYKHKDCSCSQCLIDRKKSILGESYNNDNTDNLNFNYAIGGDLLMNELLKLITGIAPLTTRNKVLQFNLLTGMIKYQPVMKVPNCKVCGSYHAKPKRKLWQGIL